MSETFMKKKLTSTSQERTPSPSYPLLQTVTHSCLGSEGIIQIQKSNLNKKIEINMQGIQKNTVPAYSLCSMRKSNDLTRR